MRARRALAAATAAALVVGIGVVAASPASAVEASNGCSNLSNEIFDGNYGGGLLGATQYFAGEQVSVTGASGALSLDIADGATVTIATGPATLTYLFVEDAIVSVAWSAGGDNTDWTVSCVYVGLPAADETADDAPPIPEWVQSYGRASKDATCLDGWSPSWESWAEPITGGWVCTRSIPSLG